MRRCASQRCTMGNEVNCTVTRAGRSSTGRALLETSEIIFRGEDARLKIPFSAIRALWAREGELHLRTKDGRYILHLGARAEKWRVKSGEPVTLIGQFPSAFCTSLKKHGAKLATPKAAAAAHCLFFAADSREHLADVKRVARSVRGTSALWIVYPKGQKHIR